MQSKNELRTAPEDIITSVTAENGNGGSVVRVQGKQGTAFKRLSSRVRFFFGCRGCCRKRKKSRSTLGLPEGKFLLPKVSKSVEDKICLVVDLDETLVHSTFKASKDADFIIPVLIEYHVHKVYVKKRPYVDHFIDTIGPLFECVLFTASLSKYADPLLNLLDKKGNFRIRLFREACIFKKGFYMKNLDLLGRELSRVIILDNSPHSYLNHKQNAIPVKTWVGDPSDTELLKLLPLLKALSTCDNIYNYLPKIVSESSVNFNFQEIFSQVQQSLLSVSNNNTKYSNSILTPYNCHYSNLRKVRSKHPYKVNGRDSSVDKNKLLPVVNTHVHQSFEGQPTSTRRSARQRAEQFGESRSNPGAMTSHLYEGGHSSRNTKLSETFPMVHHSTSYVNGSRSLFLPRNSSYRQLLGSCDASLIFSPAPRRNISPVL